MKDIYAAIADTGKDGRKAALCIIVDRKGSTPREVGAKMLVYENGDIVGTIGGGDLEKNVISNALKVIKNKQAELFKHDLLQQHNMCCGGSVDIYIEPIMKKRKLFIFGAGHIGQALAKHASGLDFDIYVIDDRKEYLDNFNVAGVNKLYGEHQKVLKPLPFDEDTYITIMTYSHPYDRDILAYCLKQAHTYIGMIGSKRKVEITRKNFIEAGISSKKELDKVDMPMGIDIKAEGPEEIAVSILAKLIDVKNKVSK